MVGTIIAVSGTLLGVIISGVMTYWVQKKIIERERMFSLEDEGRKVERERRASRLKSVEEVIGLMAGVVNYAWEEKAGVEARASTDVVKSMTNKIDELVVGTYPAIIVAGSAELRGCWNSISSMYWHWRDTGEVDLDCQKEMSESQTRMMKVIDDLIALGP